MSNIKITQIEKREGLYELTPEIEKELESSHHYNKDLAPTKVAERTWTSPTSGWACPFPFLRWLWLPLWCPWACPPCCP